MKKLPIIILVLGIYCSIFANIFFFHITHVVITIGINMLIFLLSIKVTFLKRLFFLSAIFFLVSSVITYYLIPGPYYRIIADWVFYFLALGVVKIIFEKD